MRPFSNEEHGGAKRSDRLCNRRDGCLIDSRRARPVVILQLQKWSLFRRPFQPVHPKARQVGDGDTQEIESKQRHHQQDLRD
jgi:hypothetical protein